MQHRRDGVDVLIHGGVHAEVPRRGGLGGGVFCAEGKLVLRAGHAAIRQPPRPVLAFPQHVAVAVNLLVAHTARAVLHELEPRAANLLGGVVDGDVEQAIQVPGQGEHPRGGVVAQVPGVHDPRPVALVHQLSDCAVGVVDQPGVIHRHPVVQGVGGEEVLDLSVGALDHVRELMLAACRESSRHRRRVGVR